MKRPCRGYGFSGATRALPHTYTGSWLRRYSSLRRPVRRVRRHRLLPGRCLSFFQTAITDLEAMFFQGIVPYASGDPRALSLDCSVAKGPSPPGFDGEQSRCRSLVRCLRFGGRAAAVHVSAERYSVSFNSQYCLEYFEHANVPSRWCPFSRSLPATCKTRPRSLRTQLVPATRTTHEGSHLDC